MFWYVYDNLHLCKDLSHSVLAFICCQRQVKTVEGEHWVAYPEIEHLLEMRNNVCLYKPFYQKLVYTVVGNHGWNEALAKEDSCELAIASNEAFTLLVVKNYYHCWLDYLEIMERGGLTHIELLTQLRNHQHVTSDKQPLYTLGGVFTATKKMKKGHKKGWSDERIRRYNSLIDMVTKDRERNNNEFIEDLR